MDVFLVPVIAMLNITVYCRTSSHSFVFVEGWGPSNLDDMSMLHYFQTFLLECVSELNNGISD